jgi:hypothetical protein
MEADLKRGTALDVAYAIVGETNTTVPSISKSQLRGADCKNATHFVATASLGAFAMRSSTDAQAGAAAEIFGQARARRARAARRRRPARATAWCVRRRSRPIARRSPNATSR